MTTDVDIKAQTPEGEPCLGVVDYLVRKLERGSGLRAEEQLLEKLIPP